VNSSRPHSSVSRAAIIGAITAVGFALKVTLAPIGLLLLFLLTPANRVQGLVVFTVSLISGYLLLLLLYSGFDMPCR